MEIKIKTKVCASAPGLGNQWKFLRIHPQLANPYRFVLLSRGLGEIGTGLLKKTLVFKGLAYQDVLQDALQDIVQHTPRCTLEHIPKHSLQSHLTCAHVSMLKWALARVCAHFRNLYFGQSCARSSLRPCQHAQVGARSSLRPLQKYIFREVALVGRVP